MDRLISEHMLKTRLSTGESRPKKLTSELIKDIFTVIDDIPSAEPMWEQAPIECMPLSKSYKPQESEE